MEQLSNKRKLTVMIAIMAGLFFSSINQTIVGNALPRIIAKLGGMDYYSWVFTIYMLTTSITTILVGKLSDMYGRKPFILTGLGIFILGSFLCGTSSDIFQLIVWRGLQGIGGGMVMSTSFTAIGDLFTPRERARWQGYMSAIYGLSSVLGPILGGYIVDNLAWHWVFWIFLPFGLVTFGLIFRLFPHTSAAERHSVDYLGSSFLVLFMVPMLLAFSWAGTKYEWASPEIIGLFFGAACALVIFLLVQARAKNPVLPLFLFRNPIFTISNLAGFALGAGMFGAIMYMPYFVQGVLGFSATASSYITMPLMVSFVFANMISGTAISRTGKYKLLAIGGLLIMSGGMYLLSTMGVDTSKWATMGFLVILGVGMGLGMPVFSLTVQNSVEHRHLGVATSSTQLFRSLGGTIGVSVFSTVLAHRLKDRLAADMAASGVKLDPSTLDPKVAEQLGALKNIQTIMDPDKLAAIRTALPKDFQGMFEKMLGMLRDAFGYSLSGVFLFASFLMLFAVLVTLFLKEIPLRSGRKQPGTEAEQVERGVELGLEGGAGVAASELERTAGPINRPSAN